MNYTENYHLPQWVETDRVQMEDFNEAMAKLDKCFGEENRPYQSGSLTVPYTAAQSSTLLTFDFEPHHILINCADTALILQGGAGTVHTVFMYSSDSGHVAAFYLQKNKVTLGYFGAKVDYDIFLKYVAYR